MQLWDAVLKREVPIAVVGLGYVGLPLAVAFSGKLNVIGFDANEAKIAKYRRGVDVSGDIGDEAVRRCGAEFTSDEARLEEAGIYIVAVPTPVQSGNVPDLTYVRNASRTVARRLKRGAVVIYESTVYPGVTEEVCIPVLEEESGLRCGVDFKVGYSPERINPGDKEHRLENIVKVVSGQDEETLEIVARLYELIVEAGVFRAESIKVAEAAKVIENAQRDINIAFMNELAMLFNNMGIRTKAVLEAASTKWNFLPFTPGLVGGHCIGIDPYYLTYKAEDSGYRSKIILAGRHINDGMGKFIAQQIVKLLVQGKSDLKHAGIGLLGITYKEDCPDIRNSKVMDIIGELREYGISPMVVDPLADPREVYDAYGIRLCGISELRNLNAVVAAVPHSAFKRLGADDFDLMFADGQSRTIIDIKGIYDKDELEGRGYRYWSL